MPYLESAIALLGQWMNTVHHLHLYYYRHLHCRLVLFSFEHSVVVVVFWGGFRIRICVYITVSLLFILSLNTVYTVYTLDQDSWNPASSRKCVTTMIIIITYRTLDYKVSRLQKNNLYKLCHDNYVFCFLWVCGV